VLDDALQALPGPGALPLLRRFHLHLGLFKTRMSRSTCQGSVLASKQFVSLMPTPVCTPVRLSATVAIYHDTGPKTSMALQIPLISAEESSSIGCPKEQNLNMFDSAILNSA